MAIEQATDRLTFGTAVYTDEGEKLGTVRGFDDRGFYVSVRDGLEGLSVGHVRAGHEHGAAELCWRCWECGELARLEEDLPDACPSCGAPKEDLYYFTED